MTSSWFYHIVVWCSLIYWSLIILWAYSRTVFHDRQETVKSYMPLQPDFFVFTPIYILRNLNIYIYVYDICLFCVSVKNIIIIWFVVLGVSLGPALQTYWLLWCREYFDDVIIWSIFRVTGPLCGEFTGHRWIPRMRPVTRSFDVFFDLCLNKGLSKQSWGWWFETPLCSLWRHCNACIDPCYLKSGLYFDVTK